MRNHTKTKLFKKNLRFLLDAREKVLNSFKSNKFSLKISTSRATPELTIDLTILYAPKETKV